MTVTEFILPSAGSESFLLHLHPKSIEVKKGHLKAAVKRGDVFSSLALKHNFISCLLEDFCQSFKRCETTFCPGFLNWKRI